VLRLHHYTQRTGAKRRPSVLHEPLEVDARPEQIDKPKAALVWVRLLSRARQKPCKGWFGF
jgi:hypothetical protein